MTDVAADLARLEPIVTRACARLGVRPEARLGELVRAHRSADHAEDPAVPAPGAGAPTPATLARLYELRARHLDWTYETGYLGVFAREPGMRYCYRRILEEQMGLLREKGGSRCLEVGSGPAFLSVLLAPRFDRLLATDVSGTALRFGRAVAEGAGRTNIDFAQADAMALPFPDGEFAAVACGETLGQVSDPLRAAREMARVLAPGGVLLLSTPSAVSARQAVLRVSARLGLARPAPGDWAPDRRVEAKLRARGQCENGTSLLRVKRRLGLREVTRIMAAAGLRLEGARGAGLELLPPVALVYPRLPGIALDLVRRMEGALNAVGILPRAFSISTVFRFTKLATEP
jgi:SAM-dependent methyltransferase